MSELNEILAGLQAACENPAARLRHYLSQGKKVVGCFPPYTPEELEKLIVAYIQGLEQ